METKPGYKTTEIWALVAGLLAAVLPVIMDKIPPESTWAVVLGAIMAAVSYIAGRSYVKGKASIASGIVEASKNGVADKPVDPS